MIDNLQVYLEEAMEKTAVFTYGRNNPPSIGHEKVFDKTLQVASKVGAKSSSVKFKGKEGEVAHIYTSHSQDKKKNPLSGEFKREMIQKAYPNAHVGTSSKEMPSMLHIAKHLYDQGNKHLIMVAGSDRVKEYHNKLHQYNGTHEKALYNFKSIKVVSAGQRDPDAEGTSGMSGTKLRAHALAGEKEKFKAGLLSKLQDEDKEKIYNEVRKSLNVNEIYDPHLKVSKYQWGEIEGVNKMKSMTPGETDKKKTKMAEHKIPYLFMTSEQKLRLNEDNMQLEFDGIQTKNLDMCPGAYKAFKSMIADIRAGKHLGEPAGHEKDVMQLKNEPELAVKAPSTTSDTARKVQAGIVMKPRTLRHMQFKQYTGL